MNTAIRWRLRPSRLQYFTLPFLQIRQRLSNSAAKKKKKNLERKTEKKKIITIRIMIITNYINHVMNKQRKTLLEPFSCFQRKFKHL